MDINGIVLDTITTTFSPLDICANKAGDVYCTASDNDKVFVVISDGKEREIYSSSDLNDPQGVAVDDHGNVFNAGMVSNNIHRLSHDGQTRDIILTKHDGIIGPTGLSYNCETRELLLINNNYTSVNVYRT